MKIYWNHRSLPELANFEKKEKDRIWKHCVEIYGHGSLKYILLGMVLPVVIGSILFLLTFSYITPQIASVYMRVICAGLLGGLFGFSSSALRISLLRYDLQQYLFTIQTK